MLAFIILLAHSSLKTYSSLLSKMSVLLIYAVSFASLFGVHLALKGLYHIERHTGHSIAMWVRKKSLYIVLSPVGSEKIDVFTTFCVLAFVCANAFALGYGFPSTVELSHRASFLFSVNVIPVYFGSQLNLFLDNALRISLRNLNIAHR